MSSSPLLIVIGGPTAVGKTQFAIDLAKKLKAEIISADSRQIYRELNIAVAKPDQNQLAEVQHHFVSSLSIHTDYTAGQYQDDARQKIKQLFQDFHYLILVGGSGLYLKAVLDGFDTTASPNEDLRNELNMLVISDGLPALQKRFLSHSPKNQSIDMQNPHRLIRAIEILENSPVEVRKTRAPIEYKHQCYFLNMDRTALYSRIDARVDQMIDSGLEQEAKKLHSLKNLNALQTVGYKEFFDYFEQKTSREEAINNIKKHSRNYAKRQLTWFRNDHRFIEIGDQEQILLDLRNRGLLNNID